MPPGGVRRDEDARLGVALEIRGFLREYVQTKACEVSRS